MGLFFSNLNNKHPHPHEVLGLPPLFTKSQARSQYLKLVRSNPSFYNSAYDCIKRDPPNLDLYTENVMKYPIFVIDLFERLGDFSGFKCPEFRSPDFYKKFKNYHSPKKFKREEERNLFNFKVRKIIKEVYRINEEGEDGDMEVGGSIKVGGKEVSDSIKVEGNDGIKIEDNVKKEKQFKCEYCSKGFRSKNQLINHFKSKKHFEKIKEKEKEPKRFIKKQIEREIEGGDNGCGVEGGKGEIGGSEREIEDKVKEGGSEQDNYINDFINHSSYISKDPIAFRTCSRCNKRFENRIKMIEHIKKEHK